MVSYFFAMRYGIFLGIGLSIIIACTQKPKQEFDYILRQGTIYDGTGGASFRGDVAIQSDTIAAIGDLNDAVGKKEIDATGLAIAPGFINMLSWADRSLLMDGRSMSDIKQGVTLEIFGEGWSPGPVKRKVNSKPADSLWTTLGGYYDYMMKKGVSPNVASFVGATSIRIHEIGYENRAPRPDELERMKFLVRQAMQEGALGVGASLIYAPADYASTEELIALSKVASHYGGMYIAHMRSESDNILKALNETFRISTEANIPAEIYHLKINHERNWNKVDTVIAKIDSARRAGLKISANMYTYTASATGLTARLPTWVQEGGAIAMRKRLKTPSIRKKVLDEMRLGIPSRNSEASDVMLIGFRLDSLNKLYRGKRLDEVARLHGKSSDETVIDLVVKDKSPIAAIYFLISEDNVRRMLKLPYVSVGSDAASMSDAAIFAEWGTHPRAYGTFARFLGKYVRDEKLITLEEAVRRMTSLPASNLKIIKRGKLNVGYFADLAVFNPATIKDEATFDNPKQYAGGMVHVFVNGVPVLTNGEHTGAKPGRVIRGQGYNKVMP